MLYTRCYGTLHQAEGETASAYLLQVEKAPVVVKSGLKKEEAEELMNKLTAGEQLCLAPFQPTSLDAATILPVALTLEHCLQSAERSAWSRLILSTGPHEPQ